MTPDADSWDEHRAWHLLGHLHGHARGAPLKSWKEEVLAAREIRNRIREGDSILNEAMESATRISRNLDDVGLDGRAFCSTGIRQPKYSEKLAFIPAILLAILAGPLTTISSGLMILAGKILGDKTDEGLDARTTYHVLAALLGPLLIWPIPAIIVTIFLMTTFSLSPLIAIVILLITPFAFHVSNLIAMRAWDLHTQSRDARRLQRFSKSKQGIEAEAAAIKLLAVPK